MILKNNWPSRLRSIRKREIDSIFNYLQGKHLRTHFRSGIEFGSGEGYQTTLLVNHCDQLISTDLNFKRIKDELKLPNVKYVQCDADKLGGVFVPEQFDFIFSSNLIEHLGDSKDFLLNTKTFLTQDGYAAHVIPGRMVKITYILFYYFNLFLLTLNRFAGLLQGKKFFRGDKISLENNINIIEEKKEGRIRRFLLPSIHGNFASHREEFIKFGRKSWQDLFQKCGFVVVKHIKGPAFSGYGFGFTRLSYLLEFFGWSSEHIFILKKRDSL